MKKPIRTANNLCHIYIFQVSKKAIKGTKAVHVITLSYHWLNDFTYMLLLLHFLYKENRMLAKKIILTTGKYMFLK